MRYITKKIVGDKGLKEAVKDYRNKFGLISANPTSSQKGRAKEKQLKKIVLNHIKGNFHTNRHLLYHTNKNRDSGNTSEQAIQGGFIFALIAAAIAAIAASCASAAVAAAPVIIPAVVAAVAGAATEAVIDAIKK